MIDLLIFLASSAAVLQIVVTVVADRIGPDVSGRFLEVNPRYNRESLTEWVLCNPAKARRYAFPVLFPLDALFLFCFGGFLGLGSVAAAHTLQWPSYADWLLALAPGFFVACDLAEDVMLARFLLAPTLITREAVAAAKAITGIKIALVVVATLQTALVSAVGTFSSY
ncbi:hypothetical protein WOC76_22405 [Methylocystis sp. IM3]|uniref:hypothetical protein n=1 Tax=unclassified Methylocystis TaxID=2625913 RepID=UPI0030F770BF